jgi:hypothetical protein
MDISKDGSGPREADEDLLSRIARELGVTREELRSAVQIGGPFPGDLDPAPGAKPEPPSTS